MQWCWISFIMLNNAFCLWNSLFYPYLKLINQLLIIIIIIYLNISLVCLTILSLNGLIAGVGNSDSIVSWSFCDTSYLGSLMIGWVNTGKQSCSTVNLKSTVVGFRRKYFGLQATSLHSDPNFISCWLRDAPIKTVLICGIHLFLTSPQVNLWLELVPHLHSLNEVTQLIPTTTKVGAKSSISPSAAKD